MILVGDGDDGREVVVFRVVAPAVGRSYSKSSDNCLIQLAVHEDLVQVVVDGRDLPEILRIAKLDAMPVITNEGLTQTGLVECKRTGDLNLRGLCKAAGVEVFTPLEFLAHNAVDIGAAAIRFVDACRVGVDAAATQGVLMSSRGGREVMSLLVGIYRWILLDEVDEKFAHLNKYGGIRSSDGEPKRRGYAGSASARTDTILTSRTTTASVQVRG